MKRFGWVASLVVLMCLCALPSAAQDAPAPGDALNLFFDCQGFGCYDADFFRREVPIVNWVRDREVSDLHVLVTSQRTGGGGFLYTLAFIGRRDFDIALAGESLSARASPKVSAPTPMRGWARSPSCAKTPPSSAGSR